MNEKSHKKEKDIIEAKYYTKNKIIKKGKFDVHVTFGKILDYFVKNNNNKFYKLKSKYIFNGKTIHKNQIVSKLIQINSNSSLGNAEIWIEIDIDNNNIAQFLLKNILKTYQKNMDYIISIIPVHIAIRQITYLFQGENKILKF